MHVVLKTTLYALAVLFVLLIFDWHSKLKLTTILVSAVVFGYAINSIVDLYRKFHKNISTRS
ncbi:hypothetical protein Bcell_3979 [Evansella cellulosilytica DSM 2522]|uniref:Uncharacterized protein n=1 Tax=Evansella cellulosilytica (strain ATCC 21833 / DSM 2522 / FERM P-1141 / JCM 9156 / N-4) TaxID=649639 RepID=E6TWE9_EVAC2|nr:hypothetical protein Bcell_3979 [Evansella cellulosilytica DSM 2522]